MVDKYEYKQKTEQMLELMEEGAYSKAAVIADAIDWKRVRNTKMLIDVSEIYEKSGDYRKSYDVLNIAYHRAEGSRKVLYQLCTLALKTKNVDEAIDYYDEFVQIAPKDPNQYILRYQILRAQRAPVEQQIEVLEAFKKAEYIEEWAYELAKLYQEAGMTAECLDECDDLILWFSEGKYVYQAMELKMRYKPLTPSQQEKYDHRFDGLSNETVEMPDLVEYKNSTEAAEEVEEKEELKKAGEVAPKEDEIPLSAPKTPDIKKKIGNTMKLDEALKSLLNFAPDTEGKERDSSGDPVSTDVVFEEDRKSSFDTAIEEIESIADLNLADTFSGQKGIKELKVDPDLEELRPEPLPGEVGGGDTIIFQKITQEDLQRHNESAEIAEDLDENAKALMEELDAEAKALMEGLDTAEASNTLEEVDEEREENGESEAPEQEAAPEIKEGEAGKTVPENGAERENTQIEGQMSLLDLMAGFESLPDESDPADVLEEEIQEGEKSGTPAGEPEQLGELPEVQEEVLAEHTVEDVAVDETEEEKQVRLPEENAGEEERMDNKKKVESILPADIQRLIDEIEGVIPEEIEEDAVMSEEISEEELFENMGEVAESLRVDESSEVFEDYDDVLDEEEYAEELQEEEESEETAEYADDYGMGEEKYIKSSGEDHVEEAEYTGGYEEAGEYGDAYEEDSEYAEEYKEAGSGEESGYPDEYEEGSYEEDGEYEGEAYEEEAYVEAEYEEARDEDTGEYAEGIYEEAGYEEDGFGETGEYEEGSYEETDYEEEGSAETDEYVGEYEEGTYGETAYEEDGYEEVGDYAGEYEEESYGETAYEEDGYEEAGDYAGEYEEESYGETAYEKEVSEETGDYTGEYEEESYEETDYKESGYEEAGEYEEESYEETDYEEDGYEEAGDYADEYEEGFYEEEDEYEEGVYEEDGEYTDAYEDEYAYEEGSELIEESLKEEFSPNWDAEDLYDEREMEEEEEEEEIDLLSATTPLSRKETAKMIATGKTSPLPLDEISDALSMSDTGFIVHGKYDLKTQSGIGTRAGLTEEQKKLFSYFVPVRGMSEQLVDVLEQDKNCTNRQGTSSIGNLLIIGNKGNGKTVLAVDVVKAIQKQRGIQQGKVAIVTGDSLNKKKISDIFNKLYGGALIIEKAGKMNEKTVARVNKAMERDTGELLIVLEDQRKPLDRLLSSDREFRRKFTSRLEVPILINDELVTFGQAYAQENGYQIDEMGILALYSRIDTLQREDHAVTIAEVKEVMDEAMEHSQKASAKKLMRRVFGRNTDDSDRIILTEKDFN